MDDEPVACLLVPADCLLTEPVVLRCTTEPEERTALPAAIPEPCDVLRTPEPEIVLEEVLPETDLEVLPDTVLETLPDTVLEALSDVVALLTVLRVLPDALLTVLCVLPDALLVVLDAVPAARLTEPVPAFDTDWAVPPAADRLAPLAICEPVSLRILLESTPIPSLCVGPEISAREPQWALPPKNLPSSCHPKPP